ncbi:MAG: D-aminoacyl-tRNA deacylase [Verrucomicrobiota bacterium]
MRALLQRVSRATVSFDHNEPRSIGRGFVVLLGVCHEDESADAVWLARKCAALRLFEDDSGERALNLLEIGGEALVVSQFTLFASTRKGTKPSYHRAAAPPVAEPLYREFVECLRSEGIGQIQTGEFGALMRVDLVNDGPVTLLIDSKAKE